MKQRIVTLIGKSVRKASQMRGSGGSALPGLVIEKLDPKYMARTLRQLPRGVAVVTGTNGKTTTTKIVVELLESQGLKVFTNKTGSNFTRGVIASLLESASKSGELAYDIAVLELDEAYAVKFAATMPPTHLLLLNVLRDQLDRFGEIDSTAQMLRKVAHKTTSGLVFNRDDPRLNNQAFLDGITCKVATFGVSTKLQALFPSDDTMHHSASPADILTFDEHNDTELLDIIDSKGIIKYSGKKAQISFTLKGIFNMLNATAALALVRQIMGSDFDELAAIKSLATIKPAFGRGEDVIVNGKPVELVLIKNPSGFRLSLKSFSPKNFATMIAINDNYADGRDMSWLWDVNFESLKSEGVSEISGTRAYDMALRLQYDEVDIHHIEPDTTKALNHFLQSNPIQPKRIYCTYTAMLAIRKALTKYAKVEKVL